MTVICKGHDMAYEMYNMAAMFFSADSLVQREETDEDGEFFLTEMVPSDRGNLLRAEVLLNGRKSVEAEQTESSDPKEIEKILGRMVYRLLSEATGVYPPWGISTGIRPVKLVRTMQKDGLTDPEIRQVLREEYLVSQSRIELALETAKREQKIIDKSTRNSFSLYVGIPFCPSRCSYCSFVSQSTEKTKKYIEPYFELILKEIEVTGRTAKKLGLDLRSIYIGGGTPTILSHGQLAKLIETIGLFFDVKSALEFTLEAGRPDTITREKLEAAKGVSRLSINPQSMNDEILRGIGRRHGAEEIRGAYALARSLGYKNINMDLIAGLPEESYESFVASLNEVIDLGPENITVHTLSTKRASHLNRNNKSRFSAADDAVFKMVEYATDTLQKFLYAPYYLYRQRNTLANLENVSYSKAGYEGLYNVFIMDETHTILSCGAGGVTKLVNPETGLIKRVFNFKHAVDYIDRFEEILDRKDEVIKFYEE